MMKKMTEKEVLDVVRRIYTRTWGWPDGTTFCGMEADEVNRAMEFLLEKLKNGGTDGPEADGARLS